MSNNMTKEERQAAGRKGGLSTKARGINYKALGQKGGKSTLKKMGADHFKAMSSKGHERLRTLVAAGKAALEKAND